jgi:hypothetical protein
LQLPVCKRAALPQRWHNQVDNQSWSDDQACRNQGPLKQKETQHHYSQMVVGTIASASSSWEIPVKPGNGNLPFFGWRGLKKSVLMSGQEKQLCVPLPGLAGATSSL